MFRKRVMADRRPIKYAWAASLSAVIGMLVVTEGVNAMRWAPVLDAVIQVMRANQTQQVEQTELLREELRVCGRSGTSQ